MKITTELLVESFRNYVKEGVLDDFTPDIAGKVKVGSVLDEIKKNIEGKTLIFFDTETTGFFPKKIERGTKPEEKKYSKYSDQLTEIAAIAVNIDLDGGNSEIIGKFNKLCTLSEPTRHRIPQGLVPLKIGGLVRGKPRTPGGKAPLVKPRLNVANILDMTNYFKNKANKTAEVIDEKDSLEQLDQFIKSFPNPLLVIHNASFDIGFIKDRAELVKANVNFDSYEFADTLEISRAVFCPVVALNSELSHIDISLKTKEIEDKETGQLKHVVTDKPSSTLGALSKALAIDATEWHTAIADVKMLLSVFSKMFLILNKNKDLDITEHYNAVMSKSEKYAEKVKNQVSAIQAAQPQPQPPSTETVEKEPNPQNESKLSEYWKSRSHKKSDRAKRKRGNKQDREWAMEQQEYSKSINSKVHKLFEKELTRTDEMSDEITSFLKKMKKEKRRQKKKMLEKKLKETLPNPYSDAKVTSKYPYSNDRKGVVKTFNRRSKNLNGKSVSAAPGEQIASLEEDSKKVAQPKKVVKSKKNKK